MHLQKGFPKHFLHKGIVYCKNCFNYARLHKTASIIALSAVVLVVAGSIIGGMSIKSYFDSILPKNAVFQGISLAGMNQQEVNDAVNNQINSVFANAKVTFQFNNNSYPVSASDYQFHFNPETVFHSAKEFDFSKSQTPLCVPIEYDSQKLNDYFNQLAQQTQVPVTPSSYEVSGTSLIVTAGQQGVTFDVQQAVSDVVDAMTQMKFLTVDAVVQPIVDDTIPIHLDQVHNAIKTDVADATYSIDNSGKLTYQDQVTGVDFDLSQAQTIVTDPSNGSYTIPLIFTKPKVTTDMLKQEHDSASCPALISTYTTTFSPKDQGRNFNIARAASFVNGTVLYPGEAFSFHRVVGNTGQAQGYQESTVYSSDGMETGYGGGICQVSTTIYLAALYANMDITERHNHSYTVSYVPPGFDATVSDGGPDLKFKNSRKDPIKIMTDVTSNSITVSLYSTPSDDDNYQVTMQAQTLETIPQSTEQRVNFSLPSGTSKVKTNGQPGYKVNVTKTVTYKGEVVSTENIPSTYKPLPKIIEVGAA